MKKLIAHLHSSFVYLPSRKITNLNLFDHFFIQNPDKLVEKESFVALIKKYTGIDERRYCLEEEASSDLAVKAILPLLEQNPKLKEDICALILATTSGDHSSPATANWVHFHLGLNSNVQCLDVASSCSSFLSAFRASAGFLNAASRVLVVASEAKHKSLSKQDLRTLPLFADGAGGFYLSEHPEFQSSFEFAYQEINSELANHILTPAGGSRLPYSLELSDQIYLRFLEPKKMFLHTVKSIVKCVLALVDNLTKKQQEKSLRYIFIHQANKNILNEVRSQLPLRISKKIPSLMADVGNMVCASLPVLRTRVLFLWALISAYEGEINKSNLNEVFLILCSKNSSFKFKINSDGIIFYCRVGHENISVFDGASKTLEESWLNQIDQDEFQFIYDNIDQVEFSISQLQTDLWVSAGGGFQTLGVIHCAIRDIQ